MFIDIGSLSLNITGEYKLMGYICSYLSLLEVYPEIPDINISIDSELNGSFSFKQKEKELRIIFERLQNVKNTEDYVEVTPLNKDLISRKYKIPHNSRLDFLDGYYNIVHVINGKSAILDTNSDNYMDYIPCDEEYLQKVVLIKRPSQNNFNTKVSAYLWILPNETVRKSLEQRAINLINIFLLHCDSDEHKILLEGSHYLRFSQYHTLPENQTYVYGYLRSISDCSYQDHINRPYDYLSCEINYAGCGFFYEFPKTEWKDKKVEHIREFYQYKL